MVKWEPKQEVMKDGGRGDLVFRVAFLKWAAMLSVAFAVLACQQAAAPWPLPAPTASPISGETDTPTTTPLPVPPPSLPARLFLAVHEPLDETETLKELAVVAGSTLPAAVVSVNGEITDVDGQGRFTALVRLEEGPNLIEVVVSDETGEELIEMRVVFRNP